MTVNRAGIGVRNFNGAGSTPKESRLTMAGILAEDSPGVPRRGLLTQNEPAVVTGTGSMAYIVRPCQAVTTRDANEGVYLPTFTLSTSIPTDPAPGSGFRYDLIWVKQNDPDKGDPNNLAQAGVTLGIASSSPARPTGSVPAGAYVIAEALVPAGATNTNGTGGSAAVTITQVWLHTAARGAPIPVRGTAERAALIPAPGDMVRRLDRGGILEPYVDGAWGTRDINVPFNTGWGNVASELPLRVERSANGAMTIQGYVRRVSGTSNTIATIPAGSRPRKDITWTETAENDNFQAGPVFRFYLNASTGGLGLTRILGGPAFDNNTTKIPVNSSWIE